MELSRSFSRKGRKSSAPAVGSRHRAAALRLRPQAHKRQQVSSPGERRSTPHRTSFLQSALGAHSKNLGSALINKQFELGVRIHTTKLSRKTMRFKGAGRTPFWQRGDGRAALRAVAA
jgi:hypothetical protein